MKKKAHAQKATLSSIAKSIEGLATKNDVAKSIEGLATKKDIIEAIDELAIITKRGFDTTVSKAEFTEFREDMTDFKKKTDLTLFNLDSHARTTNTRLDSIEKAIGPLVHLPGVVQRELREHDRRISLIERKVGISK